MKTKIPRISEAEWEVMRIIWQKYPVSSAQIVEAFSSEADPWSVSTIKTLLTRLGKKGVLKHTVKGRARLYSPRFTEPQCVAAASESFLIRVFRGALQPMLAHFIERKTFTPRELKELEEILTRQKQKQSGKRAS